MSSSSFIPETTKPSDFEDFHDALQGELNTCDILLILTVRTTHYTPRGRISGHGLNIESFFSRGPNYLQPFRRSTYGSIWPNRGPISKL